MNANKRAKHKQGLKKKTNTVEVEKMRKYMSRVVTGLCNRRCLCKSQVQFLQLS